MKVILVTDVKKVGQRGSVVEVADGYAMNVLIPQKKAVPATPDNLKKHERGVTAAKQKADASATQAQELLAQIDGKILTINAKAGPTGTLFKSLHARDIALEIQKQWHIELPESAIMLEHVLKQKGTVVVRLSLFSARAEVSVVV